MDTKVLDPTSGDDGAQVAEKENIFGSPDKKLEAEKIRRRKEESGEIKVTLKRILGFYSASIPVIKDSLDVAWKFAPIFLFFPAMMLWSYLRKIGWEQLFSDAVVSISGFIVMFVTACLLMFAVFVQFIFPSMIIGPVVSAYEEIAASGDEKFKDDLSRAVWRLHLSTPIGWLFILALSVIALDQPPWLAYTMSIVAAYVVALYFVIRNRNIFLRRIGGSPMPPGDRDTSKKWYSYRSWMNEVIMRALRYCGRALMFSLFATLGAVAVSVPMLLCLELFSDAKFGTVASLLIFLLLGVFSMAGMAPGLAYLLVKIRGNSTVRASKAMMLVCVFVGYLLFVGVLYFAPVTTFIMRASGVLEERPHIYQILKPELVAAMRAVRINVVPVKPQVDGQPAAYFAYAFTRFSFNNVLLLCRGQFNFSSVESTTWNEEQRKEKAKLWAKGGDFCVKAKGDEIRPLRLTLLRAE